MVQIRQPHSGYWHLNICLTIAPRWRISRCEVSVTRKWQLPWCRHLLQIGCRPILLVSSVQGLTDHPCCAAGSSKNQNHNAEEHLDAGSAIVCVADIWVQLIYSGGMSTNLHVTRHLTIRYKSCGGVSYEMRTSDFLLFSRGHVLSFCLMTWMIEPRTCCRRASWMITAWLVIKKYI